MNSQSGIRTNLLITTAVTVTVGLALFMSQQDGRGGESLIANLVATVEMGAQESPLSILLPTTTAVIPELTATATATATATTATGETTTALVPYCANTPAHWLPHTVRDGETIYSLSIASGATVSEIAQANCLQATQIITGLTIYLPPQQPTRVACGPPSWWYSQLIYAGDTLYGLAVRHGTTVYAIMHANCLSSGYLVAGRTLYLPPVVVPPVPPTVPPLPTLLPTVIPPMTITAVPTIFPTLLPTLFPTANPTMTATIPSTMPPITATVPLPTATLPPLPTIAPTETAVSTPISTPTTAPIPPTVTPPPPPTATIMPPTATIAPPTATTIP